MGISKNQATRVAEFAASYPVANPLADALFTSTQQRVLGLLFGQPERSFFATEIIGLVGAGSGAVQRELEKLTASGLLTVNRIGNRKHYQANPNSPIYGELCALIAKLAAGKHGEETLLVSNTIEVSRAALDRLADHYHVRRLVLFGSAARGELTPQSDVDLLVEFKEGASPSLGGMVELQEALSRLFGGRKVDLATPSILNNPYRRHAIERDMEVLYEA